MAVDQMYADALVEIRVLRAALPRIADPTSMIERRDFSAVNDDLEARIRLAFTALMETAHTKAGTP